MFLHPAVTAQHPHRHRPKAMAKDSSEPSGGGVEAHVWTPMSKTFLMFLLSMTFHTSEPLSET